MKVLIFFIFFSCSHFKENKTFQESNRVISSEETNLKKAQEIFKNFLISSRKYNTLKKDIYLYHWRDRTNSGIKESSKFKKENSRLAKEYIDSLASHFWSDEAKHGMVGPGLYTTHDPYSSSRFAFGTKAAHGYGDHDPKTGLLIQTLVPKGTAYLDLRRNNRGGGGKSNTIGQVSRDITDSLKSYGCNFDEYEEWRNLYVLDPICRKIMLPVFKELKIHLVLHHWWDNMSFSQYQCQSLGMAILLISTKKIKKKNVLTYISNDFQKESLSKNAKLLLYGAKRMKSVSGSDALIIQKWDHLNRKDEVNNTLEEKERKKWLNRHANCIDHVLFYPEYEK